MTQHAPHLLAQLLEDEAYRLRVTSDFEDANARFGEALQTVAADYRGTGESPEEEEMIADLASGNFKALSLVGGRQPVKSYDYSEDYSRSLVLLVAGIEIRVDAHVTHVQGDGYTVDSWLDGTKPLMEKNPALKDIFQGVLGMYQPDFFLAESRLGKESIEQLQAILSQTLDGEQREFERDRRQDVRLTMPALACNCGAICFKCWSVDGAARESY